MKKDALFNAEICYTLSQMGHTDCIAIGDAGLPIPDYTKRIDLAVTYGIPTFLQVLDCVTASMQIEQVILANEIKDNNPTIHSAILERVNALQVQQNSTIEIKYLSHEQLKENTAQCKAVIRTGECTPYANIILQSGVIF